jgi:hypothetical protein
MVCIRFVFMSCLNVCVGVCIWYVHGPLDECARFSEERRVVRRRAGYEGRDSAVAQTRTRGCLVAGRRQNLRLDTAEY